MSPLSKPVSPPAKSAVVQAFHETLSAELVAVERVAAEARDETTNSETKQEGKYDTRAIEASYLARGQAWRIVALRRLRAWFAVVEPRPMDRVQTGALVGVEDLDSGDERVFFVAPEGGRSAEVEGTTVELISPKSPLCQAMSELEEGDDFVLELPRGRREYVVSWVA